MKRGHRRTQSATLITPNSSSAPTVPDTSPPDNHIPALLAQSQQAQSQKVCSVETLELPTADMYGGYFSFGKGIMKHAQPVPNAHRKCKQEEELRCIPEHPNTTNQPQIQLQHRMRPKDQKGGQGKQTKRGDKDGVKKKGPLGEVDNRIPVTIKLKKRTHSMWEVGSTLSRPPNPFNLHQRKI